MQTHIPLCMLRQLVEIKTLRDNHKCPLCNTEITIEKIKEAKKKRREDRKKVKGNVVAPLVFSVENNLSPGPRARNDLNGT